jgi:prolyl-tRNA synthetase
MNQWCNVMRWEKSTRPFLRTAEFLWQEGHTAHASYEEAQEETMKILGVYKDFAENVLAIPVLTGRKSEKEKFAGAMATYTMEAMMQDGKALQMGTSHNMGTNFAKSYEIQYLSKEGKLEYCNTTSWGTSTRMIGGVIMVHGDDRGLQLPPRIAPYQVVIIPIAAHKGGVVEKADELFAALKAAGIRVTLDMSDQSAGWKFNQWEMKGVPIRLELGPKDIEKGQAVLVRRDTFEKIVLPIEGLAAGVAKLLDDIHDTMFNRALQNRLKNTTEVDALEAFQNATKNGFALAPWCGERACEDEIKATTGATTRCYELDYDPKAHSDRCVFCGKPAQYKMYFAKAY